SGRSVGNPAGVLAEGTGCDVADVVTGQADVGQRVVRQVAEFVHRAAVGNPVLCDADRVHVLLLEMLAGRSVLPVCDACIRDTSVNVQCKENAAAMHLCNKTVTKSADGASRCSRVKKRRNFRQLDKLAARISALFAWSRM